MCILMSFSIKCLVYIIHRLISLLLILLALGNSLYIMDTNSFCHVFFYMRQTLLKGKVLLLGIKEPTLTGILANTIHIDVQISPLNVGSCPKFMAFVYKSVSHTVLEVLTIFPISHYVYISPLRGKPGTSRLFNSLDE